MLSGRLWTYFKPNLQSGFREGIRPRSGVQRNGALTNHFVPRYIIRYDVLYIRTRSMVNSGGSHLKRRSGRSKVTSFVLVDVPER
jgi:hypothetical protein